MTPAPSVIRPNAARDLDDLTDYLSRVGVRLAERFQRAAQATFEDLAAMPEIGSPYPLANPRLRGLRSWQVRGFPNHVVFYRPLAAGGVEIIRVLHAARDVQPILEAEA